MQSLRTQYGGFLVTVLLWFHWASVSEAAPTLSLPASVPGSATTTPDKATLLPILSTDGRYLTVYSNATNLVAGFTDNNEASQSGGANDIYQRDLNTGIYTLVSHAAGSTTAGANSRVTGQPRVSDDGRFIVFSSDATDLVTGQGGSQRPYLWDRTTGENTFLADVQCQATGPVISGDGHWIALCTVGLMPKNIYDAGQGNLSSTIYTAGYLINRVSGAVTLMTHVTGNVNTAAAADLQSLFISNDGGYCAFETALVSGWDTYTGTYQTNSEALYLYNRVADTMTLVTKRNDGAAPSALIINPAINHLSADGRYLYFTHGDVDFGTGTTDNNSQSDLYRYDRDGGVNRLSRLFFDAYPLSPAPNNITIATNTSSNGRYIVFLSLATNLVPGDTNGRSDVYRFDTTNSSLERVNVLSNGDQWTDAANGIKPATIFIFSVASPKVNDDGEVLFVSTAKNLGFTDSNETNDVFMATYGAASTAPTVTTPTSASVTENSATLGGDVTADGGATVTERGVVYALTATNADPEIGGTGVVKVAGTGTTGVFTVSATGLVANSGYSFKAYATNSKGTTYTSAGTFSTLADMTAPTVVSVTRSAPPAQAISTSSVTFRVTYSEPVTGVAVGRFVVMPVGGSDIVGTVTGVTPVSTSVYDVAVTITSGTGEFRLRVQD